MEEFDVRLLAPIATLCAICVTIYLWFLNKKDKRLSYQVLWNKPLVNVRGSARKMLDVRFEGKAVTDAFLIVVKIFNSGHLPLNPGDFLSKLRIQLSPGAEIITATAVETAPADLEERLQAQSKKLIETIARETIELNPVLLNAGDSITIQVLARKSGGRASVEGHIQGIPQIHQWRPNDTVPKLLTQAGAFIMAIAMLGVEPPEIMRIGLMQVLPFALLLCTGVVFLQAGLNWKQAQEIEFGEQ